MSNQELQSSSVIYSRRAQRESKFYEFYRCFSPDQEIELSARAQRIGKPFMVFDGMDDGPPVIEVRNAKNYLINGRTEIRTLENGALLGSYTRLNAILDSEGEKIGRWRDARSWGEEFRENLVDALANAALGAGDVPGSANTGDTHLFSQGKNVLASLQKERMAFFPDPPKSESPGRIAKMAGRILPGELGRSLRENLPPYGWSLCLAEDLPQQMTRQLVLCTAILRIEMLRYARSA